MNRITRLVCARVYFFGLYGSIHATFAAETEIPSSSAMSSWGSP